jgi:hypothetical protein
MKYGSLAGLDCRTIEHILRFPRAQPINGLSFSQHLVGLDPSASPVASIDEPVTT